MTTAAQIDALKHTVAVLTDQVNALTPDTATPPPVGTPRPGINFGYFGGGDPTTFADHCNFMHIGSWGDWVTPQGRINVLNKFVSDMHAAVANGIKRIMITTDWCVYTPQWHLLPVETAQLNLTEFFDAIRANGLLHNVAAIYAMDEPGGNGMSEATVRQGNATLRDVASWYWGPHATPPGVNPPIVTTFNVGSYPGIESFDWCGYDNYGTGFADYDGFVRLLKPEQRVVILPGGSDPWRDDPAPYYAKAQADSRIIMIMPFMWFNNPPEVVNGIQHNGMAAQYRAVGQPIKAAYP